MGLYDLLNYEQVMLNRQKPPVRPYGSGLISREGGRQYAPVTGKLREFGFTLEPNTRQYFRESIPVAIPGSSTYGYRHKQTSSGEGVPIPKIYGKFRTGGHVIGSYAKQGNLFILLSFGWGAASDLTSIWIEENPIESYPVVTTEIRLNGGSITFFPGASYPDLVLLGINSVDLQYISGTANVTALVDSGMDNPSDIVRDMLTNTKYGAGIPSNQLNSSSFSAWKAFCVTNNLKFNGIFDAPQDIHQAITQVAQVGRAHIQRGYKNYSVIIDQTGETRLSFTTASILRHSLSVHLGSRNGRANRYNGTFSNEEDDYRPQIITVANVPSGEQPVTNDGSLFGITNREQAINQLWYELKQNEIYMTVAFTVDVSSSILDLKAGDIVHVSHPLFNGQIKIDHIARTGEQQTRIEGHKYDASIYSGPPGGTVQNYIYQLAIATVTQLQGQEVPSPDGGPAFKVSWVPNDITVGAKIFVKLNNSGRPMFLGQTNDTAYTFSDVIAQVVNQSGAYTWTRRPLALGDIIQVYVVGFDVDGRMGKILEAPTVTTVITGAGVSTLTQPGDVENFTAQQNGVNTYEFFWTTPTTPPGNFYELRYDPQTSGASWNTATVVGTTFGSPITLSSVQPGTYLIKAVSGLGGPFSAGRLESANAASIVIL